MKKFLVFLLFAALFLSGCSVGESESGPYLTQAAPGTPEWQYTLGQMDSIRIDQENYPTGDIVAEGKDFKISKKLYDSTKELLTMDKIYPSENLYEYAIGELIIERALYYYALNQEFTLPEDEINRTYDEYKASMEDQNAAEMDSRAEGAGMSKDEYWEAYYPLFKRLLTVNEYQKSLYQQYRQSTPEEQQNDEAWLDYLALLVEKAINIQQFKFSDDIDWKFEKDYISILPHVSLA